MALRYNPAIEKLEMPAKIARLPVDRRGYPVPRFVTYINGQPDFRVVNSKWVAICRGDGRCWICGEHTGVYLAFVIGPMCSINRISSEPPSHLECAQFACKACPFMLNPQRGRNEENLPEGGDMAGLAILRNPGVSLIWVTRKYSVMRDGGGLLFKLGEPTALEWWTRGRKATHDEIMASIESGLPILREAAEKQGPAAVLALEQQVKLGLSLVPA